MRFTRFSGAFHGFESFAAATALGRHAHRFECDAFGDFVDRYVLGSRPRFQPKQAQG